MGKSKLDSVKEQVIINDLIENNFDDFKSLCKKYDISYRVLERIRKNIGIYGNHAPRIDKDDIEYMLIKMREHPEKTYDEWIKEVPYTKKQLEKIRAMDVNLPSLVKAAKQKQNNSFVPAEKEEEILNYILNNPNTNYEKLENIFGFSQKVFERIRKNNGNPPLNRRPAKTLQYKLKQENKRYCPNCGSIKRLEEFHSYKLSYCKQCEKIKYDEKTGEKKLSDFILYKIKNSVMSLYKRHPDLTSDIDFNYIMDMYNSQNGKCFYSGRILELSRKSDFSLSIDRIDSKVGYMKGNIVLCCKIINYMKQEYDVGLFLRLCKDVAKYQSQSSPKIF